MSERANQILQTVRERWDPQFAWVESEYIPWSHLDRSLDRCRLGYVSTAGVYLRHGLHQPFAAAEPLGDPSFREFPRNVDLADVAIAHAHYDQRFASQDPNVVFPLDRLVEMERMGVIGELAPLVYSFHGFITRPERLLGDSALNLLVRLRRMQVDAVLLSATSPLCHQSAALLARSLEAAGIPTLVAGIYPELWQRARPPRAVWMHHPEGATFGPPGNVGKQQQLLKDALAAFAGMQAPGSAWELPYRWNRTD